MKTKIDRDNSYIPILCWLLMIFRRDITVSLSLLRVPESISMGLILLSTAFLFFVIRRQEIDLDRQWGTLSLLVMLAMYAISLILAWNSVALDYLQNFLFYCCLTSVYCSGIRSSQKAIVAYGVFSVIAFALCGFLPLLGKNAIRYSTMEFFDTGMSYGENVAVPGFIGLYTLLRYRKKLWALPVLLVNVVLMLMLANRSSLLVAAFFVLVYELWIQKTSLKKGAIICLGLLAGLLILMNIETILLLCKALLDRFGIRSYSITKFLALFEKQGGTKVSFTSGRDAINANALSFFLKNPVFGIGIGQFSILTDMPYTHNLITDILSTTGIIGAVIFFPMIVIAIVKMLSLKKMEDKLFVSILFSLWFPRLLFSKTFVDDVLFWTFIVYALSMDVGKMNKRAQWNLGR